VGAWHGRVGCRAVLWLHAAAGSRLLPSRPGWRGGGPQVQFEVAGLKELKAQLELAQQLAEAGPAALPAGSVDGHGASDGGQPHAAGGGGGGGGEGSGAGAGARREVLEDGHPYATVAVWQLPATPLFFESSRAAAKDLAKELASISSSVRV